MSYEQLQEEDDLDGIVDELEQSNQSVSFVEDSFSELLQGPPATSTPSQKKSKKTGASEHGTPRIPCTECKKTYANERTLNVHSKMQKMQGKLQ